MPNNLETKIAIREDYLLLIALSFLLVPTKWVIGWLVAAIIHELFHMLAIKLCHVRIDSISAAASGAVIQTEQMDPVIEILCTLAGPLGALLLLLLKNMIPHIALCALAQSAYNLLPVFPLDGGRVVKCVLQVTMNDQRADKICYLVSLITIAIVIIISACVAHLYRLGLFLSILPAIPLIALVHKNSLQRRKNNSTILKNVFNSERNCTDD